MQVLQRAEHLAHVGARVQLIKALIRDDVVEELATAAQLHHDVHEALVNVRLVELDDVGVVHRLQNAEFVFEMRNVFLECLKLNRFDSVKELGVRPR